MNEKPTEEMIFEYIIYHTNEDWPMDQTVGDFYKKVNEWHNHKKEVEK